MKGPGPRVGGRATSFVSIRALLLTIDIGALTLGAEYRGDFQERLNSVLDEAIRTKTGIALFIDEPDVGDTILILRSIRCAASEARTDCIAASA